MFEGIIKKLDFQVLKVEVKMNLNEFYELS